VTVHDYDKVNDIVKSSLSEHKKKLFYRIERKQLLQSAHKFLVNFGVPQAINKN
jgi:hypothetical protein